MALDPNIILQAPQQINPLDTAVKAMTLKSLSDRSQIEGVQAQQAKQDFSDNQALRSAFKNNMVTMSDGSKQLNRQGVMSDLNMVNPMLAAKAGMQFRQMDLDKLNQQHAIAKQILFGIDPNNQESLNGAIEQAKRLGLPPLENAIGTNVNAPNFQSNLRNAQIKSLSAEEQLAQANKQFDQSIAQQNASSQRLEANAKYYESTGRMPGGGGAAPASVPVQAQGKAPASLVASNNGGVPPQANGQAQPYKNPVWPYGPPPKVMSGAIKDYQDAISSSRKQNPDVQQSFKDLQSADKINGLIAQAPKGDLNKLSDNQVQLITGELVKLATNGAPTEGELEKMTPDTLVQKYARAIQAVTGRPVPANAKEFIEQFRDYANDIGQQSMDRIKSADNATAARFRPVLGESQYADQVNQNGHQFDTSLTRKILRLKELQAKAGQK